MQPSPEQFGEWLAEACRQITSGRPGNIAGIVARLAYAAGADAELEECRQYIRNHWWGFVRNPDGIPTHRAVDLLWARRPESRPKPPSLKQQALEALRDIEHGAVPRPDDHETIRRALEALPE
jgi:hypothetical protein